jgi:iron complex transport system permease protein
MRKKTTYYFVFIFPVLLIFVSLFLGRYHVDLFDVIKILWCKITLSGNSLPEKSLYVVWEIRLPRLILGAMVGASLAVSGAAFQGLFRNPLVSSSILGVSSGAGFGAAFAILAFQGNDFTYIFAFIFGLLAVFFSYSIGKISGTSSTVMLVLGGTVVSTVFSSLISLAKYVADPYDQLPTIVYWLMGSLASAKYQDIFYAGIPMFIGVIGLILIRWRINILSMGDREAQTLGININFCKAIVIICSTLATAGAVCVSGNIGWIGLIIPHIGRMLFGNDNKTLLPICISLGAIFLILVDDIARLITGSEIPLGILTSLVGGPFFVYLLKKTKGGGWK